MARLPVAVPIALALVGAVAATLPLVQPWTPPAAHDLVVAVEAPRALLEARVRRIAARLETAPAVARVVWRRAARETRPLARLHEDRARLAAVVAHGGSLAELVAGVAPQHAVDLRPLLQALPGALVALGSGEGLDAGALDAPLDALFFEAGAALERSAPLLEIEGATGDDVALIGVELAAALDRPASAAIAATLQREVAPARVTLGGAAPLRDEVAAASTTALEHAALWTALTIVCVLWRVGRDAALALALGAILACVACASLALLSCVRGGSTRSRRSGPSS